MLYDKKNTNSLRIATRKLFNGIGASFENGDTVYVVNAEKITTKGYGLPEYNEANQTFEGGYTENPGYTQIDGYLDRDSWDIDENGNWVYNEDNT